MKTYNEKKICFIICTNDEVLLNECLLYISLLRVPKGFDTEILTIMDAESMTAGYNEGMNASDAKYKIYLHQDTLITEIRFLEKLIRIFQKNKDVGLIGMIGAEYLSKDGVMWHEERCGNMCGLDELIAAGYSEVKQLKKSSKEVEVIDGFLMATQYDIPWREDILKGWDFYDVSQSLEFRRAGYKVLVPAQRQPWTDHACGVVAFWNYEEARKVILREYPEIWENKKRLRILFLHSESIQLMDLISALLKMGHCVVSAGHLVNVKIYEKKDVEKVEEFLEEGNYDLVVTFDFSMGVSEACENWGVEYYAWCYDCPLVSLYSPYAKNSHTHIGVFDRMQYRRLKEFGIPNLYYVPLGTVVDTFGHVNIRKSDEKKYAADIAFVGRLYDDEDHTKLFDNETAELKEEFERITESCDCRWDGKETIYGKASDELIECIGKDLSGESLKYYQIDKRFYAESMKLARRCNQVERVKVLNRLAEKFRVTLYSDDTPKDMLQGVKLMPWVDYWAEMPKVFYLSKINLNITSRSIETGIPQRIFDIMAVGGFVLTNYQEELEEYFEIGKDLEVYHNLDELMEKAAYYLSHEEQRIRIGINGYKKVREQHTYENRLGKILPQVLKKQEFKKS